MTIELGIIFGLIGMLGFGLANGISKVPITRIGYIKTIFFRGIFVSLLLLAATLLFLPEINFAATYILIAIAISFLGYFPLATFFKALEVGKVGIISPIANSSVIFTILFSIIFFKESLTLVQIFSILLIVLGVILISVNFKDIKNSQILKISSGIPYALVTTLLWGVVFFLLKIPVNIIGPFLTAFILEFGIFIFSSIHLRISKISFKVPDKNVLAYIFFIAFFSGAALLAFNLGIRVSDVSIVAALTAANPLVVLVYGKLVYKEKLALQQYVAAFLILAGIILISK